MKGPKSTVCSCGIIDDLVFGSVAAVERVRNIFDDLRDFDQTNGSRQGGQVAMTELMGPISLGSGVGMPAPACCRT